MNRYGITQFLSIETKLYFIENWSKGGILYVKDLFDINGNFKTLGEFSDSVLTKNNWLCEYYILKNVFSKLMRNFDLSNSQFTNIKNNMIFNLQSGKHLIIGKKCNFFTICYFKEKFRNHVIKIF